MSVPLFLAAVTCWKSAATANNISERGVRLTKTDPDAIRPDLASWRNNLSATLGDLGHGRTRWPPSRRPPRSTGNWPPGGPMPTTSWNNRYDLLTGSSTVKATHPRGNLRRDNGPLSGLPAVVSCTSKAASVNREVPAAPPRLHPAGQEPPPVVAPD